MRWREAGAALGLAVLLAGFAASIALPAPVDPDTVTVATVEVCEWGELVAPGLPDCAEPVVTSGVSLLNIAAPFPRTAPTISVGS